MNRQDMKRHVRTMHSEIRERIKCSKCDKTYACLNNIKIHMKMVHDKIKDHHCEHCDNAFSTKSDLKRHMITHSDWNRIKCRKCGKIIASQLYLKAHIKRVHEKIKDHHCEYCDKAFSTSSDLSKHKTTHQENRQHYKCNKCEKKYLRKDHLNQHYISSH